MVSIDIWNDVDQLDNCAQNSLDTIYANGVDGQCALAYSVATKISMPDNYFDVVLSSMVLHNLGSADARKKALMEIIGVLKQNGKKVIVDFQYIDNSTQYISEFGYPFSVHIKYNLCPPVSILIMTKEIF